MREKIMFCQKKISKLTRNMIPGYKWKMLMGTLSDLEKRSSTCLAYINIISTLLSFHVTSSTHNLINSASYCGMNWLCDQLLRLNFDINSHSVNYQYATSEFNRFCLGLQNDGMRKQHHERDSMPTLYIFQKHTYLVRITITVTEPRSDYNMTRTREKFKLQLNRQ